MRRNSGLKALEGAYDLRALQRKFAAICCAADAFLITDENGAEYPTVCRGKGAL